MRTINIFTSVDVASLIMEYKSEINDYWKKLAKQKNIEVDENFDLTTNTNKSFKIMEICKDEPRYTIEDTQNRSSKYIKLISSKACTIEYMIEDSEESNTHHPSSKSQTSNYNLTFKAKKEDCVNWWGQTMSSGRKTQGMVTGIFKRNSKAPFDIFKHGLPIKTFDFNARNIKTRSPRTNDQLPHQTPTTYRFEGQVNCSPGKYTYDLELMLFSQIESVGIPIAMIKISPTIIVAD